MLEFTVVFLNWRVVWDGLRPNVGSEMVGHITLPPSPFFLIPKVRHLVLGEMPQWNLGVIL